MCNFDIRESLGPHVTYCPLGYKHVLGMGAFVINKNE